MALFGLLLSLVLVLLLILWPLYIVWGVMVWLFNFTISRFKK